MYSFVVDCVMEVVVWRNTGAFDESFLVGAVMFETSPEEFGFSGLEIAE